MNIPLNNSPEEFIQHAKQGMVVPLFKEVIWDIQTPVGLFSHFKSDYSFLLESAEGNEKMGRFTLLGTKPKMVFKTIQQKSTLTVIGKEVLDRVIPGNPFDILKEVLHKYKPVGYEQFPTFAGGGVGYFGYEMMSSIETIRFSNKDELECPDSYFVFPTVLVVFDHYQKTIRCVYNAYIDDETSKKDLYDQAQIEIDMLLSLMERNGDSVQLPFLRQNSDPSGVKSNYTQSEFCDMVEQARQLIRDGECIQTVLSQRFEMDYKGDDVLLYRVLRSLNPSPYMYLLRYPEFSLVGTSPEMLVKETRKEVIIRPIAGTRKRTGNEVSDQAMEEELRHDQKEIAEHVMLVDLARNDIGRVCVPGSVSVQELMTFERYSHVIHMVSQVKGFLSEDKDAFDLLKATFPAGTVSGAPKIRAMEIIEDLENLKRGPYAGAVGYFSYDGSFDSCIIIRTVLLKNRKAYVQAGAGIVFDSSPDMEYKETQNKARGMLNAVLTANRFASGDKCI